MMWGKRIFWGFFVCLLLAAGAGYHYRLHPVTWMQYSYRFHLETEHFSSRSIPVNGMQIHYYVGGPEGGQPVVLIHGLGSRAEDWRLIGPEYATWLFRVYLIDLPGFGQSDRPKDFSYSMGDQAEVVKGFLDALGIKQADVGGWSMGGWIAQRLAIRHPECVNKLILFDSAGLRFAPDWNTRLFTPTTPGELDELFRLLTANPPQFPPYVASDLLRSARENAWVTRRAMDAMLSGRETTEGELPSLKMPVLILWGEDDRVTPLSGGKQMNKLIPQSQLMSFTGCGHLAPLECADKVASVAVEFSRQ